MALICDSKKKSIQTSIDHREMLRGALESCSKRNKHSNSNWWYRHGMQWNWIKNKKKYPAEFQFDQSFRYINVIFWLTEKTYVSFTRWPEHRSTLKSLSHKPFIQSLYFWVTVIHWRTLIVLHWFTSSVELYRGSNICSNCEFIWYKISNLKSGSTFGHEKIQPNVWLEKLLHTTMEIFKFNEPIDDGQNYVRIMNPIIWYGDG